jgi:hypothetical protein
VQLLSPLASATAGLDSNISKRTFFSVLFIAPVTPLLQCDPNPIAVTIRIESSFIRSGTWLLRPLSLPASPARTTTTSPCFSAPEYRLAPAAPSPRASSPDRREAMLEETEMRFWWLESAVACIHACKEEDSIR